MLTLAKDKLITSILLTTLLVLFFAAPEWQTTIMFFTWCSVVGYCLMNIKQRLLLLVFQITLFTFLITRLIFPYFFSTGYIEEDIDGTIRMFNFETLRFIHTTLIFSIIGSYAGYAIIPQRTEDTFTTYDTSTPYISQIRYISKIGAYICSLFYIILIFEKILFVFQNGYFELYADFNSQLPSLIHKPASLYIPLLFLFLATFPSKQEARRHIWWYFIISLLSLGTGSRTGFMLALIFLLLYFYVRNMISPEDPWLTRKATIAIISSLPILLAGMFLIDFIRARTEISSGSALDLFINFFYQQGISAQVIGLTYEMQDLLGDRIFSFGQIIDNFNKNFVFQLMGTAVEYRPQTEEMALYGHSLGNTLTYYHVYRSFMEGVGLGTSYIAEAWHDFGYIGVTAFSMLYGAFFAKFYDWTRKGVWPCVFGLIMFPDIIYAPRGHASACLGVFLSVTILIVFYLIHIFAKRYAKQCGY